MLNLLKLSRLIDRLNAAVGRWVAWLVLAAVLVSAGNAVVRNRVKRRLRELARLQLSSAARSGHDYVLIGRASSFGRAFPDLEKDLVSALKRLHRTAQLPADKGTP